MYRIFLLFMAMMCPLFGLSFNVDENFFQDLVRNSKRLSEPTKVTYKATSDKFEMERLQHQQFFYTIPNDAVIADPAEFCSRIPGVRRSKRVQDWCSIRPRIAAMVAVAGIRDGLLACKEAMKDNRWTCKIAEEFMDLEGMYKWPIMKKAYRERALVEAFVAAGTTARIAKECALGSMTRECQCGQAIGNVDTTSAVFNDKGLCDHNIEVGSLQTKAFFYHFVKGMTWDNGTTVTRHSKKVSKHNFELGADIVELAKGKECSCHGVSGGCEIKTCWETYDDLYEIKEALKAKYKSNSNRVLPDGKSKVILRQGNYERQPLPDELIYMELPEDFCSPIPELNYLGLSGRICDQHRGDLGCEALCCNRGFQRADLDLQYECDCQFAWCCQVECTLCSRNISYSVCK